MKILSSQLHVQYLNKHSKNIYKTVKAFAWVTVNTEATWFHLIKHFYVLFLYFAQIWVFF